MRSGLRGFGVVVVPRTGDASGNRVARLEDVPSKNVYIADPADGAVSSFSSTLVRQAILAGDEAYLGAALSKQGAQLLCKPTAAELQIFQEDFAMLDAEKKHGRAGW
mmetsp:Transcript_4491/g.10883  ORF Transcript_4491/g.10883 Transcript_4491/m.10883 type:complete len:107 (+) Transcript_4491:2-322(+)